MRKQFVPKVYTAMQTYGMNVMKDVIQPKKNITLECSQ